MPTVHIFYDGECPFHNVMTYELWKFLSGDSHALSPHLKTVHVRVQVFNHAFWHILQLVNHSGTTDLSLGTCVTNLNLVHCSISFIHHALIRLD